MIALILAIIFAWFLGGRHIPDHYQIDAWIALTNSCFFLLCLDVFRNTPYGPNTWRKIALFVLCLLSGFSCLSFIISTTLEYAVSVDAAYDYWFWSGVFLWVIICIEIIALIHSIYVLYTRPMYYRFKGVARKPKENKWTEKFRRLFGL